MFLLMDIMPVDKELKIFQDTCQSCRRYGKIRLIKTSNCFRLFFIPIFQWGTVYNLEHDCGSRIQISEEDAIALLHAGVSLDSICVEKPNRCTKCGRMLEPEFVRCPYCRED